MILATSLTDTMIKSLGPVALLIAIGAIWRALKPGGLDALHARRTINLLVLYIFYPAFAYNVISHADFGSDFFLVPLYTWLSILISGGLTWIVFSRFKSINNRARATLVLACSFGNILSIGLSVLDPLFGHQAARYVIYADILGIQILFWSFGAGISKAFGETGSGSRFSLRLFLRDLLHLPPIWAFALGFIVNLAHLPNPAIIVRTTELLGQAVVPTMLLTVGMSLSPKSLHGQTKILLTAIGIKLVAAPLLIALISIPILGKNELSESIILLSGTPTMMALILLSERYRLDTELLATVMVATTIAYFAILPCWLLIL